MMTAQLTEEQLAMLHAIDGTKGDAYSLARYCEEKGLYIQGDQDNMQLSYICVADPSGADDFWSVVVGEIRGDEDAVIAIPKANR